MTIEAIKNIADSYNYTLHEYEEEGVICGFELEGFTNNGVNMLHFIDCRDFPDKATAANVFEELKYLSSHFDADHQIDIHRQDPLFRSAFSIRSALNDFDEYDRHFSEFVREVQKVFDLEAQGGAE